VIATGTADPVVSVIEKPADQKPVAPSGFERSASIIPLEPVKIRVFNLNGRVILAQTLMLQRSENPLRTLEQKGLRRGSYVVEVKTKNVRKFSTLQILR
jgi:hypothetical protein